MVSDETDEQLPLSSRPLLGCTKKIERHDRAGIVQNLETTSEQCQSSAIKPGPEVKGCYDWNEQLKQSVEFVNNDSECKITESVM